MKYLMKRGYSKEDEKGGAPRRGGGTIGSILAEKLFITDIHVYNIKIQRDVNVNLAWSRQYDLDGVAIPTLKMLSYERQFNFRCAPLKELVS